MEARLAMHKGWNRAFAAKLLGLLLWSLLLGGVAAGDRAVGQSAPLDVAIAAELRDLGSHANTIFVGQLVGIRRQGGVVEVRFRVEQPVRGALGPMVVLREWGGNWAPGQQRYVVGARVLAFLHGTSAAGLSSPVHGAEGLVPVVVQGANAPRLLDVRRVAASVVRAPGTPLPTERNGALPLNAALALFAGQGRAPARVSLPLHAKPPVLLLSGDGGPVVAGSAGGLISGPTLTPGSHAGVPNATR